MTREEAIGVIKFEKNCVLRQDTPQCNRDCKKCDLLLPTKDVLTAYDMVIKALEQEPCEDRLAIERYQDLVDFFCDKDIAKEVLEDRENFKKWLGRIKWHIGKVDELARKLDQLSESYKVEVEMNARLQQQLDRASAPKYEYRMVRSFHPSSRNPGSGLDEHLKAGYEFVRASEYIPPYGDKVGYIEYILRRKKRDNDD